MLSRLRPHPTPRSAVNSAFAISPASVRGSLLCSFRSSSAPVYYPVWFELAGPPGRTRAGDTILPFASAAGKPARRCAPEDVQRRPRNLWFAVHHAAFRTTDTVQATYVSSSGAGYPRLTVERAFLCKVD